jgi:hypothetical protein
MLLMDDNEDNVPIAAAAPVTFARAPALHNQGILDYGTSAGAKLFAKNTTRMYLEGFDIDPDGVKVFLAQTLHRATNSGWTDILDIPTDLNDVDVTRNLVKQYGMLRLEQIRDHVATYLHRR